jgi:PEGA domain
MWLPRIVWSRAYSSLLSVLQFSNNMTPPLTTRQRSKVSNADSDTELTWPPPEDARFGTGILDLEARRLISIDEAARELDLSATMDDTEPPPVPAPEVSFAHSGASPVKRTAERGASGAWRGRVRSMRLTGFPRRSLTLALAVIVIVQAIVMAAVLVRGRSPRDAGPPARPAPPLDSAALAPRPAVVPAQAVSALETAAPGETPPVRLKPEAAVPALADEGRLAVRSDPAGASVVIDGRRRGTTPVTVDGLAAGSHRVQIATASASLEQVVTIEAGSTTTVVVPLNAIAGTAGWLSLASPIGLEIFENGQLLGTAADGPLRLGPGAHRLELVNEPLGYRGQQAVVIRAGEVARVRPPIPDGVLHVNAQPWANVWVDGTPAGETPLANIKVPLGQHEIRFRHPSLGEQVRQVVVSAREPARISVSMKP